MPTAATIHQETASHWYSRAGEPCYEVPYADPAKGMRATTLRDAKKLGLLPSPTSILRILDKPALNSWRIEQSVLTVITSPRASDEEIDAFVKRVLQVDKEQDAESLKARELGSQIHANIESALKGNSHSSDLDKFVSPAVSTALDFGIAIEVEKILVGDGYAGKTDCICENDLFITVIDFKTTKTLPKESYPEAKLQLSAYAAALGNTGDKQIQTANIYISTTEPGKIATFVHQDWQETFEQGFKPLQKVWCWLNDYWPEENNPSSDVPN
jgi:CRISPR/Cas system-associated exonuclease Cas4 (RecB family)